MAKEYAVPIVDNTGEIQAVLYGGRMINRDYTLVLGIVLFSGSLYLLSVTGLKKLGAVTPFGGLAFLIGWFCLALSATR